MTTIPSTLSPGDTVDVLVSGGRVLILGAGGGGGTVVPGAPTPGGGPPGTGIMTITSTGLTVDITNPTGPTVNLEVAGMGYDSLTGAGQTATPGDLTQLGGFTVTDAAADGISLTSKTGTSGFSASLELFGDEFDSFPSVDVGAGAPSAGGRAAGGGFSQIFAGDVAGGADSDNEGYFTVVAYGDSGAKYTLELDANPSEEGPYHYAWQWTIGTTGDVTYVGIPGTTPVQGAMQMPTFDFPFFSSFSGEWINFIIATSKGELLSLNPGKSGDWCLTQDGHVLWNDGGTWSTPTLG